MKGVSPWQARVLDGKRCNELWLQLGTLARVQAKLSAEGIRSPRSGGEITRPAISMSIWRYCVRNPDESFETEVVARAARGEILTRDQWNVELVLHARMCLTASGYRKFLKKNGLENVAKELSK
jgi:hypothetical protein